MNYTQWTKDNLTNVTLQLYDRRVSLWRSPHGDGRPTILLVHGITGDHYGLVPLLIELSKTHNCIVVELPGHGYSESVILDNAAELQKWFNDLYILVEQRFGIIDAVCAHSFGCTAVVGENHYAHKTKTILLNPVPHPSALYAQYARIIMRFAGFWAIFYNWRMFVFMRSLTLAKVHGHDPHERIGWVSRYSRPSYRQVVYQAGLVDIILDTTAYSHVKDTVDLVVCGLDDTTASQRDSLELEAVFGSSLIKFLRGGHLVPIESPARVAALIREVLC